MAPANVPTDDAIRFLKRLRRSGPWILTAINPNKNEARTRTFTDVESARDFIAKWNLDAGWNVYYSANLTKHEMQSKPAKTDIEYVEYLHVDADPEQDESPDDFKKLKMLAIEKFEPRPTFIVNSGNGIQLLWRLMPRVKINGPDDIASIEDRNRALAKAFGASPITRDVCRILRLPGTVNFPNAAKRRVGRVKRPARLIEYHDFGYSLSAFPGEADTQKDAQPAKDGPELPRNLQALLHLKDHHPYPSRSELLLAFLRGAIQKGIGYDIILNACMDQKYLGNAIYQHCTDNRGKEYLRRQIDKARRTTKTQPTKPAGTKKLKLVNATDVIMRPVAWLWPGHLACGEQELLTGMPGLGKSTIQAHEAACATTGCNWPDGRRGTQPGNVIMVTAEDSLDHTVVPRLKAAGADLERVKFITSINVDAKERSFLLDEDLDELEKAINKIGNVVLVTIDPITAFQGRINANSPTDVRGQLGPLKRLAERTCVAFSTITHPPKSGGERALDQFIGSQAYIAAGRIAHVCVAEVHWDDDHNKVPTGRIFFTNPKSNLWRTMPTLVYRVETKTIRENGITISPSCIVWEAQPVDLTADQVLAAAKAPPRAAKVDDFLRQLLADGPMLQTMVIEAGKAKGFTEGQIKRAKERLVIKSKKAGLMGGWSWSLPGVD
jgi:putative DNA primase/helicase